MSAQHTPGPWHITGFQDGRIAEIRVEGRLALLLHSFSRKATEEDKANMHLIAAAPELLEALENLSKFFEADDDVSPTSPLGIARAAIAKARGQA